MLSSLLSNIAGFFSKYFFATSYLPVLLFGILNAAAAYWAFEGFHDWLDAQLLKTDSITKSAVGSAAIALITLVLAFALSGLVEFFRRLLEGKWWSPVQALFIPAEATRLERLESKIEEIVRERDKARQADAWIRRAREARGVQRQRAPSAASDYVFVALREKVQRFRWLRIQRKVPPVVELEIAFADLSKLLESYDADRDRELDGCHEQLVRFAQYAQSALTHEHMSLITRRQSDFGDDLAPTRMGNIANAMQAYAVRRYNCNLELVWTSLQMKLPADAKESLQDSKAKLDFMVACIALSAVSAAAWLPILYIGRVERGIFLAASFLGPFICWIEYLAATEQYRAFADVVTSCLDLARFELLKALKLAAPGDLESERRLWEDLHQLANFVPDLRDVNNMRYRQADVK